MSSLKFLFYPFLLSFPSFTSSKRRDSKHYIFLLYFQSDEDIRNLIEYVVKLKNDVATNKKYDLLTVDTPEAKKWNEWILSVDSPYYFTNTWVFSECYVYRRLREGCELTLVYYKIYIGTDIDLHITVLKKEMVI